MSERVLRIGRLRLSGVAPGDAAMLTAALRQELARRFADAAPAATPTPTPSRLHLDAGSHAAEATAAASGRSLATAIHKAVIK